MKKIIIYGNFSLAKDLEFWVKKDNIDVEFYNSKVNKGNILVPYANNMDRFNIIDKLLKKGFKTPNFISTKSYCVSNNIGQGSIIFPNVYIGANVKIGENCIIMPSCVISHDCVIEDNCYIAPNVTLGSFTTIKEFSFIGINVSTKPNVMINEKALVGVGSVVVSSFDKHTTICGNPARELKG